MVETLIPGENITLIKVGSKDVETLHRVGDWPKRVPRATIVYLANADIKKKLIHASNLTDTGIKIRI